jgi:hypothetical protein
VDTEKIFVRFFLPLYPPDARGDLAAARRTDANPAGNASILGHLHEAAARFAGNAGALFGVDLGLDRTDASVHRLSAALTRERRDAWMAQGAPGTADSVLFNMVVHAAAYVGACVVELHEGRWGVRRPLWESVVRLRSRAGEADLAVFHWLLKSLADGGQDVTLADRYRTHVEVPRARPEELPVVAEAGRALPRLKKPRYDLLHKYLRAHLPELRDLGENFPSPERFDEYALRWLDVHLVGGGRMVLMAGGSAGGLHLMWLSAAGFDKSAFYPCDAFPDPIVRIEGDRIVVMTSEANVARVHELLWWGP